MSKEQPRKEEKPKKPPTPPAPSSDQELTEDELKTVSGGLASRGSLTRLPDSCISQL